MTPYPEEKRLQNIIEQLRRTAEECREQAKNYDAYVKEMESSLTDEQKVESLKTQIREMANRVNRLQDQYRSLTGRFYSGGA